MAKIIQNCDKAYWNHVGVVIKVNGALFIVDSNASGVQADRLSWRVGKYKGGDFKILSSTIEEPLVNFHLETLLLRSDAKWIKYDFWNGGKELANRKFGWNLKITQDEDRDICSDYVKQYAIDTKIVTLDILRLRTVFPQDYERYIL